MAPGENGVACQMKRGFRAVCFLETLVRLSDFVQSFHEMKCRL